MNKSILKHEARSMKWILLLSIIVSIILIIIFKISLDVFFELNVFANGNYETAIQSSLRMITSIALVSFTIISIIQVSTQFKERKERETTILLNSLPIKKEEFFKVKLFMGIMNITIAFLVLAIGLIIVRANNMFWIKDIYNSIPESALFIKAEGIGSLLKEIGLIYLILMSFYSFLFMVQYTITNLPGGIGTGILAWLAPASIVSTVVFIFGRLLPNFTMDTGRIQEWISPWIFPFTFSETKFIYSRGSYFSSIMSIKDLEAKIIISIILISINILIGYKLSKLSKIENENMIIPFKTSRNIFKVGATIYGCLLVANILVEIKRIQVINIIFILLILIGGSIGYFISRRITQVGIR